MKTIEIKVTDKLQTAFESNRDFFAAASKTEIASRSKKANAYRPKGKKVNTRNRTIKMHDLKMF